MVRTRNVAGQASRPGPSFTMLQQAQDVPEPIARSLSGDLAISAPPLEHFEEAPLAGGNVALVARRGGLTFVNVHLTFTNPSHLGSLAERAAVRRNEVDALLGLIDRLPRPLVVAGDFNAPPTSEIHQRMRARLRDAWTEAGRGPGWTWPAEVPLLRIDFVYTDLEVVAARRLPAEGSDHLGLEVVLTPPR